MIKLACTAGGMQYVADLDMGVRVLSAEMSGWICRWSLLVKSLGVHLWTRTTMGGELIEGILMPSNAAWDPVEGHLGCLSYESLKLSVPAGWDIMIEERAGESVSWLPFTDRTWTIVGGSGVAGAFARQRHWFPSRFQFARRFVIFRRRWFTQAQAILGWNDNRVTSLFMTDVKIGVSRTPARQASVDQRAVAQAEVDQLQAARKNGMPLGYWGDSVSKIPQMPCGPFTGLNNVRDPGEQGGQQIVITPGCVLSREHALMHRMRMEHTMERAPIAMFHKQTGEILTRSDFGTPTWFEVRMGRGRNWIQQLPYWGTRVGEQWFYKDGNTFNGCPYRSDLEQFVAHDEYHYIRQIGDSIATYWQAKDPLARWWQKMCAGEVMMSYAIVGKEPDAGSNYQPFSLMLQRRNAMSNPHRGGAIQRSEAWTARAVAEAVGMGAGTIESQPWMNAKLDLWSLVQLPSGLTYSAGYGGGMDQEEPWGMKDDQGNPLPSLALNERECPTWQTPFLGAAMYAMHCALGMSIAPQLVQNLIKPWKTAPRVPDQYGGSPGIPRYVVTAVDGVPVQDITRGVTEARSMYDAALWAAGKKLGVDVSAMEPVHAWDPTLHAEALGLGA